ncbi:hypothetical protein RRG08_014206 [Elysia crispata]|uniref:Uncharacterized protein n=1 Tax=Elysia crispata TaxID=231223 RepID=A0AAE0Z2W9_9GAST|nr:hypothetical protein RRG08_014206 [Elysia crispata]
MILNKFIGSSMSPKLGLACPLLVSSDRLADGQVAGNGLPRPTQHSTYCPSQDSPSVVIMAPCVPLSHAHITSVSPLTSDPYLARAELQFAGF